jgi:hypothetical protein
MAAAAHAPPGSFRAALVRCRSRRLAHDAADGPPSDPASGGVAAFGSS